MVLSSNSSDLDFGPAYEGPARNFDFTLLFEDTILTILPATIFLLAAGTRTVWLANRPNRVVTSLSRPTKLGLLSAYATIQLAILLTRATNLETATGASIAAAALDFSAACLLFILSCFEHSRSVTPSTIIGLYLLITLPFDAVRLRTFYLLHVRASRGVANLLSLSLALKFTVLVSEAVEKRSILLHPYQDLPPEATSGIYNKSVFWWVNPLLRIGFGRNLLVDDLFNLDQQLASVRLKEAFGRRWHAVTDPKRFSLLWAATDVLKWQILVAALPRVALSAVKFAQPFLVHATINYVSNHNSQTASHGWGLVGAYFLVYFAQAIFAAASQHLMNRCVTQLRGGLVSLLYQKTLDLSIATMDPSAALTLMSADVQRMVEVLVDIHNPWCSLIDLGVGTYLLTRSLGSATYGPAIVYIVLIATVSWVTRVISKYQKRWLEAVQVRVSFTSALLQSIRNVKMLGLSAIVRDQTQDLRLKEIAECKRYRSINNFVVLLQNAPMIFPPFAAFLVYYLQARSSHQSLDIANAFGVLTILRLVEGPMNILVYSAPRLASSLSCFERIQQYLLSDTRQDNRISLNDVYESNEYWGTSLQGGDSIGMRRMSVTRSPADEALAVKSCSFGWNKGGDAVVHDIDLSIRIGSLTMIIGPVGVGKTTLLKGILSETPLSRGFVYLQNSSIAFADQEPWIPNGTIKDAIIGATYRNYSPEEDDWYHEIVSCCGLAEDLQNFPSGDATMIGTKGICLSGGQKQRMALARAVYARAEVVILDDVFSGLDNETEDLIFRRLFGRAGPLRRNRTTIIMVTHAVHRLPSADLIVSLGSNGRITEQGNYVSLTNNTGYVHSLDIQFKQEQRKPDDEMSAQPEEVIPAKKPMLAAPPLGEDDENQEDIIRRTGEWSSYRHWFRSAGYFSSFLSLLWAFIWVVAFSMPGILVRTFSAGNTVSTSGSSSMATTFIAIFGLTTGIATIAVILFAWQIFLDMQPRSAGSLHFDLLQTVLNAPLSFFSKTDVGTIINRFSQDMALVDADLPFSYADMILSFASCLMGFGLMIASGAGYFAASVPVVVGALYVIQKYYLRTSRQLRLLDLEEKAPLYTQFGETASGLATIRAFGWADKFSESNLELLDRSQRPFYLMFCIQRWLSIVLDFLVTALVTILMTIVVLRRHSIEPGLVGLGLLSVVSLSDSLTSLLRTWTSLETSIGGISRLRDFSRTTRSEHKSIEADAVGIKWPENGELAFDKVGASYSESSDLILKDVNLKIRLGERLGVCGRSGSGKSSLLASLFHLLEFRTGQIKIDGLDIAHIPRETLRAKLNVITQEPWWITTETVRFNMDPWTAANAAFDTPLESNERDSSFISALSRCQIWHVIQEKGGLDAVMKSDFLSHGQRQLFCLARAMMRQSKVVVLDEVSASVDIKTDDLMQQIIREHFEGCTVIAVAHRLNTIDDSDRVVVLSQGEVVEVGAPKTLLRTEESWFKELYKT